MLSHFCSPWKCGVGIRLQGQSLKQEVQEQSFFPLPAPLPQDLLTWSLLFSLAHTHGRLQVSYLYEELAYVLALVTLQLNHFSILGVLNHSSIAGKFL